MDLNITTSAGKASGSVSVSDTVFGVDFNESLIHHAVTRFLAGARSGTHAQKNRAAVRGGGAKPFRQKGSGRARAGTIRSPIWRGGGRTFAATTRDYSQKLNRKMYRAAMRSILSELARQDRLVVVDDFKLDQPKTKELAAKLKAMDLDNILIISEGLDDNLFLSARNIPRVDICQANEIDPVCLVRPEKIVLTVAALKQIEERYS